MRYFIWKINWDNPLYGTGPEGTASELGLSLEASSLSSGQTILGFSRSGNCDLESLSSWDVAELSQEQALDFAIAINDTAYMLEDGTISIIFND